MKNIAIQVDLVKSCVLLESLKKKNQHMLTPLNYENI